MAHPRRQDRWERLQRIDEVRGIVMREGPITTHEVIERMRVLGMDPDPAILRRALMRSDKIVDLGTVDGPNGPVTRWGPAFEDSDVSFDPSIDDA